MRREVSAVFAPNLGKTPKIVRVDIVFEIGPSPCFPGLGGIRELNAHIGMHRHLRHVNHTCHPFLHPNGIEHRCNLCFLVLVRMVEIELGFSPLVL